MEIDKGENILENGKEFKEFINHSGFSNQNYNENMIKTYLDLWISYTIFLTHLSEKKNTIK